MQKHFSEADLLETYYTQPGESMPVMMHLADCEECAARYERLERKIRGTATCHKDQPETFWTRQRLQIMRKVDEQKQNTFSMKQTMRIAAVAVFAFVLGGVATYRSIEPAITTTTGSSATIATAKPIVQTSETTTIPADPWESEELNDYQSMVDWESWGDPNS